jgi:uncharacterized membrane protein YphA (DoxX/SURF4 family)
MNTPVNLIDRIDKPITRFMARYGIPLLRLSLGIVYLWFGVLKFLPAIGFAEELAARTIEALTFGLIKPEVSIWIVPVWEILIGLGLIFGVFLRATLLLLFVQLLGTIVPLFLYPAEMFTVFPLVPTLEGQFIIKNLVLITGGMVVGSTVRGGRVVADPRNARPIDVDVER